MIDNFRFVSHVPLFWGKGGHVLFELVILDCTLDSFVYAHVRMSYECFWHLVEQISNSALMKCTMKFIRNACAPLFPLGVTICVLLLNLFLHLTIIYIQGLH